MTGKNESKKLTIGETIKTKEVKLIPNKDEYEDSLLNYEYDEEEDGIDWET